MVIRTQGAILGRTKVTSRAGDEDAKVAVDLQASHRSFCRSHSGTLNESTNVGVKTGGPRIGGPELISGDALSVGGDVPVDDEAPTIRFILLQNRQGKTRLAKYYVPLEDSEKHKVEYEVHRLVVNRDPKFTNFVEFRTHKVIYRRYAGLFFSICVDITDNELVYLECIHLFVEILDHFFSNVCELDLVFNFHKVYLILDEFILAGELQETSKKAIIERMGELEKLD
ncbi:AP-2 complex subunit sigma [Triticum urartu]|uniref:AP-2 complex subunit sigma n=1 Tax=Triticum urartu TaxID=4572 RepID=M7ZVV5_TRIUA|nr:AP-2 complex subunit sigma [Triticum urartu]